MTLLEPSGTKWIPGLFMDAQTLDSIRARDDSNLKDEFSNASEIVINKDTAISAGTDEWANSPDGIRFESHSGDTYNAHIMIVRDPSKVYLGTSTENFSTSIPGTRIDDQIETDGAIAGVNAGAFFDNGTSDPAVGSVPEGLVYSKGVCKWTTGSPPNGIKGFAGFNKDNILVVAQDNLSKAQAEELNIRDGCCFGPRPHHERGNQPRKPTTPTPAGTPVPPSVSGRTAPWCSCVLTAVRRFRRRHL